MRFRCHRSQCITILWPQASRKCPNGEWGNGPLPSVRQLQQVHDVGRDTVLRAIDILRTEGLVFTGPRRGTYFSPDAK